MGNEGFEFQANDLYQEIIKYISNIYKLSESFPKSELYGITSQLRRASVSIALNLAEGWGRFNKKEKSQFYKIGRASLYECVAIYDITKEIGYISDEQYKDILNKSNEISRRLNGLINKVENK